MKNQFLKIATKVLGLTEDEAVAKLFNGDDLNEDAADILLTGLESKITAVKKEGADNFDKGFKKAEAKYKSHAETILKDTLGIEIAEGEDLSEVVQKWTQENKKKSNLTDDDVKKHPLYRQLEKDRVPKEEYEKVIGEFEGYKQQSAKREVLAQVKPKVWSTVTSMNPKLPTDPQVSETYRNAFLSAFDDYDYQIENDDILILKEGKRVEDSFGNPLKFQDFVKSNASKYFEFQKQEAKGGAGNNNDNQTPGGAVTKPMPKSWDEFNSTRATLTGKDLLDYSTAGRAHLNQLGIKE